MSIVQELKDRINLTHKVVQSAKAGSDIETLREAVSLETQLKAQLKAAEAEERKLKAKKGIAAANKRIRDAKDQQRDLELQPVKDIFNGLADAGKRLGKALKL